MNEPNAPTDSTDHDPDPATTEDQLLGLATDTDAGITPAAGESEAAGPTADDAAPSPAEVPPDAAAAAATTAPAADPEPGNPVAELARMREDLARQKAEIARLTRLTSLQGGGPVTPPAAPKRFADMSDRDMEAEITRMATDLDGF